MLYFIIFYYIIIMLYYVLLYDKHNISNILRNNFQIFAIIIIDSELFFSLFQFMKLNNIKLYIFFLSYYCFLSFIILYFYFKLYYVPLCFFRYYYFVLYFNFIL
jgi:hypothetical protein